MSKKYELHDSFDKTFAKRVKIISPTLGENENINCVYEIISYAEDEGIIIGTALFILTSKRLIHYDISIEIEKEDLQRRNSKYASKSRYTSLDEISKIEETKEQYVNQGIHEYTAKIYLNDGKIFEEFKGLKKGQDCNILIDFINKLIRAAVR